MKRLISLFVGALMASSPALANTFIPGAVTTSPSPSKGSGAVVATTTSALINTMLVNSSGPALPATLGNLVVINTGQTDAAVCPAGGTCTCPENGAATTNGVTIPAGNGGFQFNLGGVAATVPTIVACSGTDVVQFSGW
jgi:hypothetical protein